MTQKTKHFIKTLLFLYCLAIVQDGFSTNDTWTGGSGLWQTNTNWDGGVVPVAGDTAIFTGTGQTSISFGIADVPSGGGTLSELKFNPGASTYTLNFNSHVLSLDAGAGVNWAIDNQSSQTQTFNVGTGKLELWNGQLGSSTGAAGSSITINNSHAVYPLGGTLFHNTVSMSGGIINNSGGYTSVGNNSLTNVAIKNNGDNVGNPGNLAIGSGTFTATRSTITNMVDEGGTQGYTEFYDGSTMVGGTINNNGGSTQIGSTNADSVTLQGVTITNNVTSGTLGYTTAVGVVTADSNTLITNIASGASKRAYTEISQSLSGSSINNTGGYTWVDSTGTLSASVRNRIDGSGVPGYLGVNGGTVTLNNTRPLGIDLNSTTNGFVFLKNNTTLNISSGILNLYLDTSATYNNVTRSLIYKNSGGDASSVTGTFPTVSWYDENGNAITVQATLNYQTQTSQTAPSGLVDPNGTPYTSVVPLLQVTFSYPPLVSSANQRQLQSFAASDQDMGRQMGLATQQIARAVMGFSQKQHSGGATGAPLSFTDFAPPSSSSPFLSMTEGVMQDRAEDNLKKFSPLRSGNTGIWVQPFGRLIEQRDQGGITGYDGKMTGLMVGMDHKINSNLIVGGSLGSALSTSELNLKGGKTQIKSKFLMAFARYTEGPWYVEGIITAIKNRFRSGRVINPTTVASNTHGGYEVVPSLGVGYKTEWQGMDLTPYVLTTFLCDDEKGYVETGAGANNLTIKNRTSSQLQGEIGGTLAKTYHHSFGQGTYGATLGLLVSTPCKRGPMNGSILGTGFGVESNASSQKHGIMKFSSQFDLEENWHLSFIYGGEFGTRYQAHEGGITLRKVI